MEIKYSIDFTIFSQLSGVKNTLKINKANYNIQIAELSDKH
jgi:hypothetical protein